MRGKDGFAGLSQKKVSKVIMEDKELRKFNVKFTNKAILRPVRVKEIHEQHQIDLVNMKGTSVNYEGKTYRYILSLLDIFSRFHWLCPLESKHSIGIKNKLKQIYSVHGLPNRLQSDNGAEFKKNVQKFCKRSKIKMIRCRPYHPQAQGKVERSHRVLRKKIYYDMMKKRKHGVNWVKELPEYANCLNNEKREELGWKSPFEIYYGRKSNELINAGINLDGQITTQKTCQPKDSDFLCHRKRSKSWRKVARKASHRLAERMKNYHAKKHSYKIYKKGEKVFVRCKKQKSGKGKPIKHAIMVATILKRYKDNSNYNILLDNPESNVMKNVRVEDLADCPQTEKSVKSPGKAKPSAKRHPLLIPYTHDDRLQSLMDQGYDVIYDPPGDGNCQFSALAYVLHYANIYRSAKTLREDVIRYLRENNQLPDGYPIELFIMGSVCRCYEQKRSVWK